MTSDLSYGSKEKAVGRELNKSDGVGRTTLPHTQPFRKHARTTAAILLVKVELYRWTTGAAWSLVCRLPHLNNLTCGQQPSPYRDNNPALIHSDINDDSHHQLVTWCLTTLSAQIGYIVP